jgi:hypothetical protein
MPPNIMTLVGLIFTNFGESYTSIVVELFKMFSIFLDPTPFSLSILRMVESFIVTMGVIAAPVGGLVAPFV